MVLGLGSWSAVSVALLALNLLARVLSAGSYLGLRARLSAVAPRFPAAAAPREREDTGAGTAELRRVGGCCPACGLPYSGLARADTGVIRVDRVRWHAACPKAMLLDAPGACQELQAAWRPGTRSGRAASHESGRS